MNKAGIVQQEEHGLAMPEVAGSKPASRSITIERAITLTQPWATLVAINAKRWETRSWPAKYRGWIAIHAAKSFPRDCRELCWDAVYHDALCLGGVTDFDNLPLGSVIAIAEMTDCRSTNDWKPVGLDRAFGDYSPNRYAFRLDHVRRLREPIPMRGMLGIWRMPRAITEGDLV